MKMWQKNLLDTLHCTWTLFLFRFNNSSSKIEQFFLNWKLLNKIVIVKIKKMLSVFINEFKNDLQMKKQHKFFKVN